MTELFQRLLEWVALHPHWSSAIIFAVAMAESLAIVGVIVPGVVIMFGIGALIATGSIAFWPALFWAVAGAVAGDGLSFWVGLHYRGRLTAVWPFSRYPESLAQGVAFFEKYGGKSVAVGRFFGPVRAVIPLVAGMMGMEPWRFAVANIASALAWAPAYLLPGIVFGASLELASQVAFRLVALILLLALAVWLIVWLTRRLFLLLHPYTSGMVQGVLSWGRRHPRLEGVAAALADPKHPEARGLSILATLLILGFGLFTLITGWTLKADPQSGINYTVLEGLQSLRTPWADHLMVFLSGLADLETMAPLYLSVLILLLWRRHRRPALYWSAAAGFALLVGPLLKYGFQVPRPDTVTPAGGSYAFPSGHTLWATVAYGFLAIMLARTVTPRLRWLPYSLAGLAIAGVAMSRLYLGMHWLSDVLGAFTLGIAWISALGMAYSQHTEAEPDSWPLGLIALLSISLAMTSHGLFLHDRKLDWYSRENSPIEMDGAYWWSRGWEDLPREREDLRRNSEHRLTLQYAGSLESLQSALTPSGWQGAPQLEWGNLLKLLSPDLTLQELPVLPQVHDGRHDSLLLEKPLSSGGRMVLRLWPSRVILSPGGTPLWLGLVGEQHKVELLGFASYAATTDPGIRALEQLVGDMGGRVDGRLLQTPGLLLIRELRQQ